MIEEFLDPRLSEAIIYLRYAVYLEGEYPGLLARAELYREGWYSRPLYIHLQDLPPPRRG